MPTRYAFALVLLLPTVARAECISMSATYVRESPAVQIVFAGRVADITRTADAGYRASFDVETVWKGTAPQRFDLYVWELAPEMPRFEKGLHYVVMAARLTSPKTLEGVGLGARVVAFAPLACGATNDPQIETDLGPGYPPAGIAGGATPNGPIRSLRPSPIQKIHDVPPVWPEAARQANVRGVVIVELTIGTDGRVTDVSILRGIPLLNDAALDCVRQWQYEPVMLNGHPIPMHFAATVTFP